MPLNCSTAFDRYIPNRIHSACFDAFFLLLLNNQTFLSLHLVVFEVNHHWRVFVDRGRFDCFAGL